MKNCLRNLRKGRGLNQADLADALEISRQTVIAIEADKYDPSLPMAYRIAAYFDVPVEEMFFNPWKPDQVTPDPA
jgi:putative transcriptional regulator